ncbi:MAG: hypothetical protein QXQ28_06080 [Candidatus Nezhaarchaeales archaeon]
MSVMLMMLLVSIIATIIINWGQNLVSTQQTGFSSILEASHERLKEAFTIENVKFDLENQKITVYVRNYGSISVNVASIYVNHTAASLNLYETIMPGEVKGINVSPQTPFARKATQLITVSTSRGNEYEAYFVVP